MSNPRPELPGEPFELKPTIKNKPLKTRPGAPQAESAALNSLLGFMNNPEVTGAAIPEGVDPAAALKSKPEVAQHVIDTTPTQQIELPPVPTSYTSAGIGQEGTEGVDGAPRGVQTHKLFLTGRLCAGKDFVAAAAGATIFGFADPIYALAEYYFGVTVNSTTGKDLPGMRSFLQVAGQWGRNEVSVGYPLTAMRATFCDMVRNSPALVPYKVQYPEVSWQSFGQNPTIWVDAGIQRANAFADANPGAIIAVTNCRFEFEFKALQAAGFSHWHILTSAATWSKRLAEKGIKPTDPTLKDISEQLAHKIDAGIQKTLSTQKTGAPLRAIWSDTVPSPSNRLFSVEAFLKSLSK